MTGHAVTVAVIPFILYLWLLNICVSFHACGIQTTEDAENLEIAKSMRAEDQKQKFNLDWPYR